MLNIELMMAVLEDYVDLQTSGQISSAGRYAVYAVQEQIDALESDEVSSALNLTQMSEPSLAAVVLKQRQVIAKLEAHVALLEQTAVVVDTLVGAMAPSTPSKVH